MRGLLLRWLANTLALFIVTYVVPGISVDSVWTLFLAALALGLLNAIVKPLLFWLTLPLTILTMGIFLIVLNALMLEATSFFVRGFAIQGFGSAMVGAIVLAVVSLLTNRMGKHSS